MIVRVYPSKEPVEGEVKAPPSKSHTHRAVFAALLACGESVVVNPLYSGDTEASIRAAEAFGAQITLGDGSLKAGGVCGEPAAPAKIGCGGSGTTLRFATAVASLTDEPVLIYGDATLMRRPMHPLLAALTSLGAEAVSRGGYPPIIIKGPIRPGTAAIDAGTSSQFVSALLLIAPIADVSVVTSGRPVSRPYIDMTLDVLGAFGAGFVREGYGSFRPASTGYRGTAYRVPGDWSSASFMLVLGAVAGRVRVRGLRRGDRHPDKVVTQALRAMGAEVRVGEDYVEVGRGDPLEGAELDLSDSPDLVPALAAAAAHAKGVTVMRGVRHLAFKESNRLVSVTEALRRVGVKARASADSIVIEGGGVAGGRAWSHRDHRIAMMLAVAASAARGPVEIGGFERVRDSYPSFLDHLRALGVRAEVLPE